ncbi:MAG: universal stress protein [Chloroflexi bacterium]|nr:universal stress protein [Chloroflexota bacterium]
MYQKIMVPLDGSKLAECVLPHLDAVAKGCQVKEILFVQVVEPFYMRMIAAYDGQGYTFRDDLIKEVDEENERQAREYLGRTMASARYEGTNVKAEIVIGNPADSLAEYATKNQVDLILIATHGRSGVTRWVWGSVADRILRSACVPVLMVRAPGCVPGI